MPKRAWIGSTVMVLIVAGPVAAIPLTLGRPGAGRILQAPSWSGPDFSTDPAAHAAAGAMRSRLMADLRPVPSYADVRIDRHGIEIDLVGGESTRALQDLLDRDREEYQGRPIPVWFRTVRSYELALDDVLAKLSADRPALARQGIRVTWCGVHLDNDTVDVGLYTYTPAYRDVLRQRYGPRINVTPADDRPTNG